MKRLLSLLGMLLLTACGTTIEVDDLGDNWNRGKIDPAFTGKWLELNDKSPQIDYIEDNGGMYLITSPDKKKSDSDLGKTLWAGRYSFFMAGPRSTYLFSGPVPGDLLRYSVSKGFLIFYVLNPQAMRGLLQEKTPEEKNILIKHTCPDPDKKDSCYDYVEITRLDASTLKILSSIPNTDAYWERGPVFEKIH